MTSLVQLFAAGCKATTVQFRQRVAEDIVYLVGPALEQFIRNRLPPDMVADALQETLLAIALKFDTCRAGDEAPDAEEAADLAYALELLRAAKPPCVGYLWEAFALELSYPEMGQLHGKSADAMRMQVKRCLKEAQKLVGRKVKVNDV